MNAFFLFSGIKKCGFLKCGACLIYIESNSKKKKQLNILKMSINIAKGHKTIVE